MRRGAAVLLVMALCVPAQQPTSGSGRGVAPGTLVGDAGTDQSSRGVAAAGGSAASRAASRDSGAPGRATVELFETAPVETSIGNPELRSPVEVWLEQIRAARKSLDFEEFYCSDRPGERLRPVLDAIGAAAGRGVKVRLLMDAGFLKTYPEPVDSLGRLANIELRSINFGQLTGGVQHSKYFLVDGRTTVLGSQNLDWRSLKHIHEMGVCLRDSLLARVYLDLFEMDWKIAADPASAAAIVAASVLRYSPPYRLAGPGGEDVEVWPSATPRGWLPDSALWDETAIVRRMDAASSEIAVQIYDFSPKARDRYDDALGAALRRAAARGVKVKLLLSNWHLDHPYIDFLKSLAAWPNISAKISFLPEWSGGYIPFARVDHSKYMVVDTLWTWVGTDNWTPSYMEQSRNVAASMKSRTLALQARKSFESVWSSAIAQPVELAREYQPVEHGETLPPVRRKHGD